MMFLRSCFSKTLFGIEMKTDRRVHLNYFNWLMNQLKNLDATNVVLLETGKLIKQELGDSDIRALVVDARDFVLTYTVMVKNGSLVGHYTDLSDYQRFEEQDEGVFVQGEALADGR